MKVTARKMHVYAGVKRHPGDVYELEHDGHKKVLVALGQVEPEAEQEAAPKKEKKPANKAQSGAKKGYDTRQMKAE